MATLEWSDYLAIVLYFVIVLGVGFWVSKFRLSFCDQFSIPAYLETSRRGETLNDFERWIQFNVL